jgi:hypothetical protein
LPFEKSKVRGSERVPFCDELTVYTRNRSFVVGCPVTEKGAWAPFSVTLLGPLPLFAAFLDRLLLLLRGLGCWFGAAATPTLSSHASLLSYCRVMLLFYTFSDCANFIA